MALSGTSVVFPMAASAAGIDGRLMLDRHSESGWEWSPFPAIKQPAAVSFSDTPDIVGWYGNFPYYGWFILDAGYNTGDANRIPSGSIITAVSGEIQLASGTYMGCDADVTLDACLMPRDGRWNTGPTASGISWREVNTTSNVRIGNTADWPDGAGERGGRFVLRIRDAGGATPNRVLNIPNSTDQGPWYWQPTCRYPYADNHASRLDGFGDTFDSTYTGQIGQLAMRFRRTGNPGGTYRFELWSVVSGTNNPDQMLAYTASGSCNAITTNVAGALLGKDIVYPASGWNIVSGTRYHVRWTTANTTDPTNAADNTDYIAMGSKMYGDTTSGTTGCTGSGASYGWGNHLWMAIGNYPHRGMLPSVRCAFGGPVYPSGSYDVEPVGGFGSIASGLTAATYEYMKGWPSGIGLWLPLSGDWSPMVSAVQAWVNDAGHVTSGDQAIMCLHFSMRDPGLNDATLVSGARLFISWSSPNEAPTAVAAASWGTGREPSLVTFDGSGSTDPNNDPLTYTWDPGDGGNPVSGVSAQYTYATQGTYTATLTVEDPEGLQDTDTVTIVVLPDRDWFTDRGAQDWHAAQDSQDWHAAQDSQDWHTSTSGQDWHTSTSGQDWFVAEED